MRLGDYFEEPGALPIDDESWQHYLAYLQSDTHQRKMEIDGVMRTVEFIDAYCCGAATQLYVFMSFRSLWFTFSGDMFMKGADCFIVLFSVISQTAFNDARDLLEHVLRGKDVNFYGPMLLVGIHYVPD